MPQTLTFYSTIKPAKVGELMQAQEEEDSEEEGEAEEAAAAIS